MSKNPKKKLQFISSYFNITINSHNNLNIEITTEVYTTNFASNYNKIPCFVENEIKTTNKICGISKKNYGSPLQST
jgi:hypothetical protein